MQKYKIRQRGDYLRHTPYTVVVPICVGQEAYKRLGEAVGDVAWLEMLATAIDWEITVNWSYRCNDGDIEKAIVRIREVCEEITKDN